jgi:hypothetical protein
MSLDSNSTLADIQAAYDDNASYEIDGSVSKARLFVLACRLLQGRTIKRVRSGGQGGGFESERDPAQIRKEMEDAQAWLARNDPGQRGGHVRAFDLRGFRS